MKMKIENTWSEICERLMKLSTPSICDALPSVRLMNPEIHSFNTDSKTKIAGRAYTVNSAQDSLSTMKATDDLPNFIIELGCQNDLAPILLVIASCGTELAVAGGVCAGVAKIKGFGGVITDGNCRDLSEIRATNLPFFAKGQCAKSGNKNKIGSTKKIINCGFVEVKPGELILADEDGIVVMNKEEAVNAINKAEEIQEKEAIAMHRIQEGARFDEICNLKEHMEKLEAGEPSTLQLTV